MEIQEGECKTKRVDKLFEEIVAENFPNLRKDMELQIQEAQRSLSRIKPRPRYTIFKLSKVKD